MTPTGETLPSGTARGGARVLLAAGAIALLVRLFLLGWGRQTVLDGFYLHGAWRIAIGDTPYHDFVHVAFPFVEALYALTVRLGFDLLATASSTTGIVVVATSVMLTAVVRREHGAAAGIAAAAWYATSAHLCAYHAFEREVLTNFGLAACLLIALRREALDDRGRVLLGAVIAFTITSKLTAVVGVVGILVVLARRGGLRDALVPGFVAAAWVLCASLFLFGAYGAEFSTQVFAFFFWKGESATAAARATEIVRCIEPVLALGLLASFVPVRAARTSSALRVLLFAWLGYYLLFSPSFWDHNAIDFALPASGLAAPFLVEAFKARSWSRLALVVLACLGASHFLEPRESRWVGFPHGFGADVSRALDRERSVIANHSTENDWIVAPNPLTAAIAGRRPFVSDFELEPVARGLLREFRFRGPLDALSRRGTAVVLGAPEARPVERQTGTSSRFADRVNANTLVHLLPRMLDAIERREIALFLAGELPENVKATILGAGYRQFVEANVSGYARD